MMLKFSIVLFTGPLLVYVLSTSAQDTTETLQADYEKRNATVIALNMSDLKPYRKRAPHVIYQVTLDNETFTITLQPNRYLYTPGCLIHHYRFNGTREMYPCADEDLDCYYIGSSDAHNESWVAANICDGLRGIISFGNQSLFIEPAAGNQSGLLQEQVHVVYRYQGNKQVCAVKDRNFEENLYVVYGRRKRQSKNDAALYVETRLVVDPTMYHFHKTYKNVLRYTMLAFNIASKVYRDSSLGTNIFLSLYELKIFEAFDNFSSEWTENANYTLKKFCEWESTHVTEADCSVLLTRLNLEDDNRQKGVNGLARPHGMCRKGYQCAIVEDDGPVVGITLAHEIGHLLGMTHDDNMTDGGVGIMSPAGWSGNQAFEWSKRSSNELLISIGKHDMKCLENAPFDLNVNKPVDIFPGTLYTADKQCAMAIDSRTSFYRYPQGYIENFDPCRNLLCDIDGMPQNYSYPLMDGTDCNNTRTWCRGGRCVPILPHVLPIDGAWSEWSESYSNCSRSCGGGVQIRRRKCNNPPPQYGGKECYGRSAIAKICNVQACMTDYRMFQCNTTFSSNVSAGAVVIPDLDPWNQEISLPAEEWSCKQRCSVNNQIKEKGKYADGTECLTDEIVPFGRCIDGQCRKLGCDGMTESGLKFDVCGVCNGTGNSCEKVSGSYSLRGISKKYMFVVNIPKGSSNVNITDTVCRGCRLNISVGGVRVLNSDMVISSPAIYNVLGVQIRYTHSPETVEIVGKLQTDITVEVFQINQGWVPNITYSYYKPISPQIYNWAEFQTPECSRSCGGGITVLNTSCMTFSGFVDDMYCDIMSKPSIITKECNKQACPPSWSAGDWDQCSATCGLGIQNRSVACVTIVDGIEKIISATYCNPSTVPSQSRSCMLKTCPLGRWMIEEESQCSAICGEGYISRRVSCVPSSGSLSPIDEKYCEGETKPKAIERCFLDYCYVLNGTCRDQQDVCEYYHQSSVTYCHDNKEVMWNICPKTCRFCENRQDIDDCRQFDPSECKNPLNSEWMQNNCPQTCHSCQDYVDCRMYNPTETICNAYIAFMRTYCARSCQFC